MSSDLPIKDRKLTFLLTGLSCLAAGFFFWIVFQMPLGNTGHEAAFKHSGEARRTESSPAPKPAEYHPQRESSEQGLPAASNPEAAVVTGPPVARLGIRSVGIMQPDPERGYELRSERRELSETINTLFRGNSSPPPVSLDFPLFDEQFVHLKNISHQSLGKNQGVVRAKVEGEPEGGHVLLSYVGSALAGMIHLPVRGEFYEIRTGPDGKSHILTQLDPRNMPVCGGCANHSGK